MRRFFSLFKKASPTRLGRWRLRESQDTIDLKVDWANHDCCGGPLCTNVPLKKEEASKVENTDDDTISEYAVIGSFHLHTEIPKERA